MGDSIASHVESCLGLFHLVTDQPRSATGATEPFLRDIKDEQTRFKVWAGNIGAHHTGMSSLDYRLRDSSHIRTQVIKLLQDLDNLLEDGSAIISEDDSHSEQNGNERQPELQGKTNATQITTVLADSRGTLSSAPNEEDCDVEEDDIESELGQISMDVADVVNCLLRLSAAIRNPAPHDRFAASHFTDTSHYELFDIRHVQSKFDGVEADLAERLGKAISRRRQYFKYREAHHAKLSRGLDLHRGGDAATTVGSGEPQTIASSIPRLLQTESSSTEGLLVFSEDRSDSGYTQTSDYYSLMEEDVDVSDQSVESSDFASALEALDGESGGLSLLDTDNLQKAEDVEEIKLVVEPQPLPSSESLMKSRTASTDWKLGEGLSALPQSYQGADVDIDELLKTGQDVTSRPSNAEGPKQVEDRHQESAPAQPPQSRPNQGKVPAGSPGLDDIVSLLNRIPVSKEGVQDNDAPPTKSVRPLEAATPTKALPRKVATTTKSSNYMPPSCEDAPTSTPKAKGAPIVGTPIIQAAATNTSVPKTTEAKTPGAKVPTAKDAIARADPAKTSKAKAAEKKKAAAGHAMPPSRGPVITQALHQRNPAAIPAPSHYPPQTRSSDVDYHMEDDLMSDRSRMPPPPNTPRRRQQASAYGTPLDDARLRPGAGHRTEDGLISDRRRMPPPPPAADITRRTMARANSGDRKPIPAENSGRDDEGGHKARSSRDSESRETSNQLHQRLSFKQPAPRIVTAHATTPSARFTDSVMRRLREEEEEVEENDEPDIPLHHKRPFGAGLKRKKIEFVRATESDPSLPSSSTSSASKGTLTGDLYASIVLGEGSSKSDPASRRESPGAPTDNDDEPAICPVCSFPITTSLREHEATLVHQISLTHSHPPSGLDRNRMGLRTLQSQGWDPDARRGLGLGGEGPQYPIKVIAKQDNLGIGASAQEASKDAAKKKETQQAPPRQLTAKERKALAAKERQRAERLQAEIYGRVDVERYLKGTGTDNAI
ncbi:G-patch domain-containingprotein [Purpureocillium lavendulum]|uniref:G-patch domain-containingprotein n=1 Tax=Purpureocillium lavendulum TaxID=1247861 RepID=A0AB34G065_9HYPO|nr:G-patch domain-containingprotein [Purpureocillium lavendulum]